jgi:hypothetical protein
MKILLGDFNAKVGREDTFKPTIGNESLHEISNDNGVRLVNFDISKNLTVKRRCSHIESVSLASHICISNIDNTLATKMRQAITVARQKASTAHSSITTRRYKCSLLSIF